MSASPAGRLAPSETALGNDVEPDGQRGLASREPSYARGFVLEGERTPLGRLLSDIWRSRDLIRALARKEFFVQYRRASFGVLWSVAVPVIQASVMAVILSRFIRFAEISHYPVYIFSGIVAFSFFSGVLSSATTSIVDAGDLSTRIYFPRAVFPLVSLGQQCYTLIPGLLVLLILALALGAAASWRLLALIPAITLLVLLALAFALLLSAVYVYFRDTRFAVTAALMAWFYSTPIFYPISRTGFAEPLIQANPMTGVVELFHEATVGTPGELAVPLIWTVGWCAALLALGLALHRRFDRVFADLM